MRIRHFLYNTFLIENNETKIAIDPGQNLWMFKLTSLIPKAEWSSITHILITHGDPDHHWQSDRVAAASKAPVVCGKELARMEDGRTLLIDPRGRELTSWIPFENAHPLDVGESITSRDEDSTMNFDHFESLSFDCYGTLIDWETGILSALRPIMETYEVKASHDQLLALYGKTETEIEAGPYRPYREVLKAVLLKIGDTLGFVPSRDELESFSMSVMKWPAFPDSSQALRALAVKYRLIILSNIDDDLFLFSQKLLGIEFDHVFTAQKIGSYKPSRRNFEYLIQHAGVPQNQILHVAQSLFHDIAPAKGMGFSTVWVNRRQGLTGSGATPPAEATPDLTVPDLRSLAVLTGSIS